MKSFSYQCMTDYLNLEIPPYPIPVQFLVAVHFRVDTGFKWILDFRPGAEEF